MFRTSETRAIALTEFRSFACGEPIHLFPLLREHKRGESVIGSCGPSRDAAENVRFKFCPFLELLGYLSMSDSVVVVRIRCRRFITRKTPDYD